MADDDLARQRRKRDERLLAQALPDDPSRTVGDVVADVLAAAADRDGRLDDDGSTAGFDVERYLDGLGHGSPTITTVMDYLERQDARRSLQRLAEQPSP
jgi:hypothetical protein